MVLSTVSGADLTTFFYAGVSLPISVDFGAVPRSLSFMENPGFNYLLSLNPNEGTLCLKNTHSWSSAPLNQILYVDGVGLLFCQYAHAESSFWYYRSFQGRRSCCERRVGRLFLSLLMINISRWKEKGESRYLIEPSVSLFSRRMIYSLLMCDFLKRHSASCMFSYKCPILMCSRNVRLTSSVYFWTGLATALPE